MIREALKPRAEMICALVHTNTMTDIASAVGLSGTRVRQILVREYGGSEQLQSARGKIPRISGVDPLEVVRVARSSGVVNMHGVKTRTGVNSDRVLSILDGLGMTDSIRRLWRLRAHIELQEWKHQLIKQLLILARQLGRTPNMHDMNDSELTSSHTAYVNAFGSISNAQRAAGLSPNGRGGGYHRYRDRKDVRRKSKRKAKIFRHVVCVTEQELLERNATA